MNSNTQTAVPTQHSSSQQPRRTAGAPSTISLTINGEHKVLPLLSWVSFLDALREYRNWTIGTK